jgi:DnaJ-class molecular chaperone
MIRRWTKREVVTYLDRVEPVLDKLTHWELLDVAPSASSTAIQDAFHQMAAGLHPDRLRNELDAAERERLTIVYARIAEAYQVLRDPEERRRYNRAVLDTRGEDAVRDSDAVSLLSPRAQRLFRRAQAAMRTGDRHSAILNLSMALKLHPTSSLLRDAMRDARRGT